MPVMRPMRVLFVCVGNAYRSQMAEGFARKLGQDILVADSAGLTPVDAIPIDCIDLMKEKGIDLAQQFPKAVSYLDVKSYDLVVNMTGLSIPTLPPTSTRVWSVTDPVGQKIDNIRVVRDEVERLVMGLILELRRMRESWDKPRLHPKLRGV